jgi:hypothetical protein
MEEVKIVGSAKYLQNHFQINRRRADVENPEMDYFRAYMWVFPGLYPYCDITVDR